MKSTKTMFQQTPQEFWLAEAAWAPKGRLVAYDGTMISPGSGIHVIEYWAYKQIADELKRTIAERQRFERALNLAMANAGHPDPVEACRLVIDTCNGAFQ
jgi:hypothetical protein